MAKKQFDKRQVLIAQGRCPRCGREVEPWPIMRGDVCSPYNWFKCVRQWSDIIEKEKRLTITD